MVHHVHHSMVTFYYTIILQLLCTILNLFLCAAGTSIASKFLRANGITLFKVRDETIKLLGKAEMYFFSPEHPPLTEGAQRTLDWAVDQKLKTGKFLLIGS